MTHTATEPNTDQKVPADAVARAAVDSASPNPANPAPTAAPSSRRNARSNQGLPPARHESAARPKTRPRARRVHPVLARLFELYPKLFGARFLPLKLGVFQDLLALHPEEFKREDLPSSTPTLVSR